MAAFRDALRPVLDRFRPGAIAISAGLDAHRADPLAGLTMTERGQAEATAIVEEGAAIHCPGRIVSLLEGGYDLEALDASVEKRTCARSRRDLPDIRP